MSKNLVVSVPRLEPHRAPVSVAIIAHTIELAGYDVDALDLNIKFFHFCGNSELYFKFDEVWDGHRDLTLSEFKLILKFLRACDHRFKDIDQLMVSVFGMSAKTFTHILCKYVKKHHSCKILLGGQGVLTNAAGSNMHFGEQLVQEGLADNYISGEGEVAVVEYMKENFDYPGINSSNSSQIDELNELAFPNYSYFNLDEYDHPDGEPEVFIVGSRGCVRKCTYCDVARFWPKYRYRSGENIANELIFHYETTGVRRFTFTDSLVNGSLKSFRDMCRVLAEYNQKHDAGFEWNGQYIFRPKGQCTEEDFELMAKAGAQVLYVGVETGSDKIRFEMDKKFTNEDVDYQLEKLSKYGVKVMYLMFMGYLTETLEDHHQTLAMFPRWQKYVADGTIAGVDLGVSLLFLKDTPVERMVDSHDVVFYSTSNVNQHTEKTTLWESGANPDLTIPERIRRRIETHREAVKYNWPIWRGDQRLEALKLVALDYKAFMEEKQKNKQEVVEEQGGLKFIKLVNVS